MDREDQRGRDERQELASERGGPVRGRLRRPWRPARRRVGGAVVAGSATAVSDAAGPAGRLDPDA